jgi:hypothetical protein
MLIMVLKFNLVRPSRPNSLFSARVPPGGFIRPLAHGENDLNFGASGLGFIADIAAVTLEDLSG